MRKKEIKNILIVDDEEDICYLVKNILKRKTTAKIDISTTVNEAKKKLATSDYDLAFLDMRLNDGTGADVIEFIHSEIENPPFIAVISAYTSSEDQKLLNKLKINEFISKPLSREKIINCYLAAAG